MYLLGIGDPGFNFEFSRWVAKNKQPASANGYGAIQCGSNASNADAQAQSMDRLLLQYKVNLESGCNAARAVFELPDVL